MVNPPTSMTTPRTAQTIIFVIVAAVLVALVVWALFEWKRTRRPLMLLLIAGGAVCCLNESTVDVLGHCFFPTDGWMGQTLFGRSIPLWVDITYAIFFGAFPYGLALLLRAGTSRSRMWLAIGAFWVADVALEVPMLGTHLYTYYGEQPFKAGGFPVSWMTINVLAVFMTAVVVARFDGELRGRNLLYLLLLPLAADVASLVSDLPAFWALSSNAAIWVKYVGVGATIALELWEIDVLIRVGRVKPAQSPLEAGAAEPPPSADDRKLQTA